MVQLKQPRAQAEEPAGTENEILVRVPISAKLAATLFIPLLTLVVLAGFQVQASRADAAAVREEAGLVHAAMGPNGLATALHFERTLASTTTIEVETMFELPFFSNEKAREPVDASLADFQETLSQSKRATEIYRPAVNRLEKELPELRALVDELMATPGLPQNREGVDTVFEHYSDLLNDLLEANMAVAVEIEHPDLRQGAELAARAGRQFDNVTQVSRDLLIKATEGALLQPQYVETAGVNLRAFEEGHEQLMQLATGEYGELGARLDEDMEAIDLSGKVRGYIEEGAVDIVELAGAVGYIPEESYMGFRDGVADLVQEQASARESAATRRFQLYAAGALITVIAAAAVIAVVSRSITQPLQALTSQARRMAHDRLPGAVQGILERPLGENVTVPHVQAVEVETRDEVSDVANALNTVQDSALKLAVEQAVLRRNIADTFVNLGRRNQKLLGRQIDFITDLEQGETDPDNLANLFRLDHLATRMRRNAESLLVLAGIEPPRKWAVPVRLTDVIRAALGEVEDYQRVVLRAVEPVTVVGSAAADVAHLLAELIENALVFSPPDQTVEIRGRNHPASGSPPAPAVPGQPVPTTAGYTIAVIDSGVGMSHEELHRANRRLAGAESFTVAPSKYLGHYVAGNLAARHNVDVRLISSAGRGLTATVYLPPNLIATGAQPAPGLTAQAAEQGQFEPASGTGAPGIHIPSAVQGVPTPPSGEHPAYEDPAEPMPTTTASGLPRRTPSSRRAEAPPPTADPLGTDPNEDLIETLASYSGRAAETEEVPPIRSSVPRPPATGNLAQRVRGAQLPTLQPPLLRGSQPHPQVEETNVHAPDMSVLDGLRRGPSRAARKRPPRRAPKDVHDFLASFTTGVQRGLEEAQHADPSPPGGNGGNGWSNADDSEDYDEPRHY